MSGVQESLVQTSRSVLLQVRVYYLMDYFLYEYRTNALCRCSIHVVVSLFIISNSTHLTLWSREVERNSAPSEVRGSGECATKPSIGNQGRYALSIFAN